jgi:hypothetical protein
MLIKCVKILCVFVRQRPYAHTMCEPDAILILCVCEISLVQEMGTNAHICLYIL